MRSLTAADFQKPIVTREYMWFPHFFPLQGHNIFLRRAHVERVWPAAFAPAVVPSVKSRKLGRKVQLAADTVAVLLEAGVTWGDNETLRRKVEEQSKVKISPSTLKAALKHLRTKGSID
ncbi:MAG TPA: hypothetical protein VGI22_25640 [Xanthobacteraceae bacterium]